MNVWTGTVRITADAETRYSQGGAAICTVRLVADSGYGDKKKPLWMRGVIFGKRAEGGLVPYLVKGQQLAVSGEISMNEWENSDGIKQQSLEIKLAEIELIGGKRDNSAQGSGSNYRDGFADPPMTGDDVPF